MIDYSKYYHSLITEDDQCVDVIPSIVPQWDHTPRSGWNGSLWVNSTPYFFYKHVLEALDAIKNKPQNQQILLLKSWNEWGEGNYMEPDLKNGKGYIEALKKALKKGLE